MKKIIIIIGSIVSIYQISHAQPIEQSGEPSIERKMKDTQTLVDRAVSLFKQKSIPVACRTFLHDPRWRKGELFVFVFDEFGICYCYDDQYDVIWKDFYAETNMTEQSFIKDMLAQGEKGGWVSYSWLNSLQKAYVRVVTKRGKRFIIGAGFYPESAEFTTYELVREAGRFLEARGPEETFERINNPIGRFVKGDIYLWVYDFNGKNLAHGENLAMVGQDLIDWQDTQGRYRNRDMIKMINESPSGSGWIEYTEKDKGGARKRAYVQKVVDPKTQKAYIVGGGYYPDINEQTVLTFLNRAINHLKAVGKDDAFQDFSSKTEEFVKGPLTVFVYDMNGVMMADSENPDFIGQNLIRSRDPEGRPITQMVLDQAKNFEKGWVNFVDKNVYKQVYVQHVVVPDGEFIIGVGYYPQSKPLSTRSLVEKAVRFVQTHSTEEALRVFTSNNSDFIRGDLHVFVYDQEGTCLAQGLNHQRIWRNEANLKDNKGELLSTRITNVAFAGGGWLEYTVNNASFRVYVKGVEKEIVSKMSQQSQNRALEEIPELQVDDEVLIQELPEEQLQQQSFDRLIIGSGYFL